MAAFLIHSDFGAQESKICHYFHFFPIYLPWSNTSMPVCHSKEDIKEKIRLVINV